MNRLILLTTILLITLFSCHTTPEEIPEDLPPAKYFQQANEAYDVNDLESALVYYRTFLERFPDRTYMRIEAEYEIAFIRYRQGYLEEAKQRFIDLLDKYDEPSEGQQLPEWPRVLSLQLLEVIEAELNSEPAEEDNENTQPEHPETEQETPEEE
ncbi:MAG: hypothetical protein ACLFR1_05105 [Spirochaetia bacterium]